MVFAATSKEDWYRKPRIGMWNSYAKEMGISLKDSTSRKTLVNGDLTASFVGDAAGRMGQPTGRPADHGDSDRYIPFQNFMTGNSQ
jgi:hypothetical protein